VKFVFNRYSLKFEWALYDFIIDMRFEVNGGKLILWRYITASVFILVMKAVCSNKVLMCTYQATQRHNLEDHCMTLHSLENFRAYTVVHVICVYCTEHSLK
jgi:hypothetical protein